MAERRARTPLIISAEGIVLADTVIPAGAVIPADAGIHPAFSAPGNQRIPTVATMTVPVEARA